MKFVMLQMIIILLAPGMKYFTAYVHRFCYIPHIVLKNVRVVIKVCSVQQTIIALGTILSKNKL